MTKINQKRKEILEIRNSQFTQQVESDEEELEFEDEEMSDFEGEEEKLRGSGKKSFFTMNMKNEEEDEEEEEEVEVEVEAHGEEKGAPTANNDQSSTEKKMKRNHQRVLLITSRGISYR